MIRRRMTAAHMLQIQKALGRPKTYAELQALTGLGNWVVQPYIQELRDLKTVYIADWGPAVNGALIVPMFKWGSQSDAIRPLPLNAAQRMAKSRAARKEKLK